MKNYELQFKKIFLKRLRQVPKFVYVQIVEYLEKLKKFDLAVKELDIKKLSGYKQRYRLRIGKYRILFDKYDDKLIIIVIDIGSRGDIYK